MSADDRTEWLAWRKLGIGASDVSALIGMSPYASPMSVWTDKMGLTPIEDDNDYTEYGRRAEPMLPGYFEDRNPGLLVVDQQAYVTHPDHPHHRATLDGRAVECVGGDPLGVVEYKTKERGTDKEWAEAIPDDIACQVQWQMHVDQRDHAWIGVLHGRKFCTYEMHRDDRAIAVLVDVVDRFWTDHVLAEKPPAADAHRATADALRIAYPEPVEGESVPLDDLLPYLDQREQAKATIATAKVELASAENRIKAAIGDAEFGTVAGTPVIAWKLVTRGGYEVQPTSFRQLSKVGPK